MKNAGLILESTRQENGSFRINVDSCGEFSEGDAGAHVLYLAQLFDCLLVQVLRCYVAGQRFAVCLAHDLDFLELLGQHVKAPLLRCG